MREIILIQPREGLYNDVLKPWVPLSLLSAVSKLDLEGYPCRIIDQRVDEKWEATLIDALKKDPICVGVTSMTGSQILHALQASKVAKRYPHIPVVWGGVHPTLFPKQTLENKYVDVVVKGEGEETFYQLVKRFEAKAPLEGLAGIFFKSAGKIVGSPERDFINLDEYSHVPYHLIDIKNYLHKFFNERAVLELESSRGCPFSCGFCYSPAYNHNRWRALSSNNVVERIKKIVDNYSIDSLHFIDDAFFVDKKRVNSIMSGIIEAKLKIKMGFQGVRIDTFDKMSDSDISLLIKAGARFLQFGVESGSPRILKLINKKVKVERVISLNRRLAKYPKIIPYYNFMCGFPTETKKDLFETTSLGWRLLQENKNAMISPFHHYKPYPETPLFKIYGNAKVFTPTKLEDWGNSDWTELNESSHEKKALRLLRNIEMASILVDKKMENQSDSKFWTIMAKIYRPIARFRFKNNFFTCMPEGIFRRI